MKSVIFVSGIGTGIGKTVVSAILTEALEADYWKPVQAGAAGETDTEWVRNMVTNRKSVIHPEVYNLKSQAPPHIAAREEGVKISMEKIFAAYCLLPSTNNTLIIEDAGGLHVPLNDVEFVSDLIRVLNARVILVSRNYPGSINHSLLTSKVCRQKNLRVLGWMFNDKYMDYENDITRWSGFPKLGSIPKFENISKDAIAEAASNIKETILQVLPPRHAKG